MAIKRLLRYFWYEFAPLNWGRRVFWWGVVRLGLRRWPSRVHLGCGNHRLEGCLNVDQRKTRATDMVCDVRRLPFRGGTFESVESYHVIEHLPRHDLEPALRAWRRLLRDGGKLVIECPDFDADVREYLAGRTERLDSIFGLQRYRGDAHLFGYNFERLKALLEKCGYREVVRREATDYHSRVEPCLRVECLR
jgi:predicted SAM-dependent methyltransferase